MFSFEDKVRYSETNQDQKLGIIGIMNHFQDCSTFQSEELGIGIDYLKHHKKAWVLNAWQIDILKYPVLGQKIITGTWAYGSKGVYGYRNFVIQSETKENLVQANSIWVLVNTETGMPERVISKDVELYGTEPKIDMEYLDRKIKIDGEFLAEKVFQVRNYQIDTNGHMNNSWYVQFALEMLNAKKEYLEKSISRIRVEYKKSAIKEDVILAKAYIAEKTITVLLENKQNECYAIVQFCVDNL